MISTCVLLLNAGHEATVNATVNGWWTLFRNPDQLAALRADPSLLPTAVEELMRYDTPLQLFERWVLDDIEIDGTVDPAGQRGRPALRLRQPRPGGLRRPRPLDLTRDGQPAHLLRRGHPLLPGRPAGPHRAGGVDGGAAGGRPDTAPGGGAVAEAELRDPGAGGAERRGLTGLRARATPRRPGRWRCRRRSAGAARRRRRSSRGPARSAGPGPGPDRPEPVSPAPTPTATVDILRRPVHGHVPWPGSGRGSTAVNARRSGPVAAARSARPPAPPQPRSGPPRAPRHLPARQLRQMAER